ncbi:hypothetical protein QTP88_014057 [Uroleucon formosanum]
MSDISGCVNEVQKLRNNLLRLRNEEIVDNCCEEANKLNDTLIYDCKLKATLRKISYEVLDSLTVQIDIRFKDFSNFEFVELTNEKMFKWPKRKRREPQQLKNFVVFSSTGAEYESTQNMSMEDEQKSVQNYCQELALAADIFLTLDSKEALPFINHYEKLQKLDKNLLSAEMVVAKNAVKTAKLNLCSEDIKQIIEKDIYPNLYTLYKVALVLPISSALCERSFSAMRKIKTWTRTTMGQNMLRNLAVIHIENDIEINNETVLNKFEEKNRLLNL